MAAQQEVLEYWFGDTIAHPHTVKERNAFWFGGDDQQHVRDREIAARFGDDVERALAGELQSWADEPRGRLALILLLDQFTRNIHRGTARAFAGDSRALTLVNEGLDRGSDRSLYPIERVFFLMPLQHAEDMHAQERSVAEFSRLAREVPEAERPFYDVALQYARIHHELIQRFGRFPHRNAALARANSAAEEEYLAGDVERFGQ